MDFGIDLNIPYAVLGSKVFCAAFDQPVNKWCKKYILKPQNNSQCGTPFQAEFTIEYQDDFPYSVAAQGRFELGQL